MTNYIRYEVTGVDCQGKRFKIVTTNAVYARGINVWRGTKWGVLESGKRKVLTRAYN